MKMSTEGMLIEEYFVITKNNQYYTPQAYEGGKPRMSGDITWAEEFWDKKEVNKFKNSYKDLKTYKIVMVTRETTTNYNIKEN
jgi:hypothetical protein